MNDLLSSPTTLLLLIGLVFLTGGVAIFYFLRNRRNTFATPLERATFGTLHTVALAAPSLREGLSQSSASFALPYLRQLLDTCALTMTDNRGNTLGWDGAADQHEPDVRSLAEQVISTGRQQMLSHSAIVCERNDCPVRGIVVMPLESDGSIIGTLGAVTTSTAGPVILRATAEVARYVSSQLELAELEEARARLDRAEVRALRAQISPHFVYNALTTIASFIRTDPVRARELLIEFADFTRYSFRTAGEYTTLQDELTQHRALRPAGEGPLRQPAQHQAADRARGALRGAAVPRAAAAGGERRAARAGSKPNGGTITITAENAGNECVIIVEDDGVGMDPSRLHEDLADAHQSGRARRAGQRRRPDALHVRRRLRPGGRHQHRPGHEDHPARAEVPGGHPRLSRV